MKKLISVLTVLFVLVAFSSTIFAAKYKAGTYYGQAKARIPKHTGIVKVKVRVSKNKIKSIKILKYDMTTHTERAAFQKYVDGVVKAKKVVPRAIKKKQSTNVKSIAKATRTSKAIMKAVENALAKARK